MTEPADFLLRIEISDAPAPDAGARVMIARGNLDIDSASRLRFALEGLIGTGACRIVLDLSELEFCDSVGLSTLADAQRACAERSGYLRIAAPTAGLVRTLEVVGLIGQLAVYESRADALADRPPGGRPPPPTPGPTW